MCQCLLSKPTAMPPWVKKYHVSNTEIKFHGLLASFSNFSLPWSSLVFLGLSCPAPWKHNVSTSICLVSTLAVPQTRCRTLDGQMFILFIGLTWLNWLTCIMHHNAIHCYSAYSACIPVHCLTFWNTARQSSEKQSSQFPREHVLWAVIKLQTCRWKIGNLIGVDWI